MTLDEEEIIRHTMKAIANAERKHIDYVNGILDMMCKEVGIPIPDKRNGTGERRKKDV